MTLRQLRQGAADLRGAREHVSQIELNMMAAVADFLKSNRGGVREIARKMGFSPQYICDVQHGRRKISNEFLERLGRL